MGSVYRKQFTKPLPSGAKIITRKDQQLAEWKDAKGRRRTAPVTTGRDGSDRITVTAGTYTAKYRDGSGILQEVATGCRDESAARSILNDLEKQAEKVKGKLLSADEAAMMDRQNTPLADHIADYIDHQQAKGVCAVRVKNSRSRLARIATECGFRWLSDLAAVALERWLVSQRTDGMGAGNWNEYRQEAVGFGNWCVRTRRLLANPFASVPRADAKADRRRERRALTHDEAARLLRAAELRPIAEHGRAAIGRDDAGKRSNKRSRKTWTKEPLSWTTLEAAAERGRERLRPDALERAERKGRERRLVYRVALATGMRRAEVRKLAVGWLQDLDGPSPSIVIQASDEKSRRGAVLPLRADVAAELCDWLSDRFGRPADVLAFPSADRPVRDPGARVFDTVPAMRAFDRDLQAASVAKADDRGRTLDFHSLRHTFGTWLSAAGVAPRVAQAAMRHSSIDLTMNVYTDPRLLDVAGAMEALPALPATGSQEQPDTLKATGTDDRPEGSLAPMLAPASGNLGTLGAITDKAATDRGDGESGETLAVSGCRDKRKGRLSTADNRPSKVERRRFELPTSALRTQRSPS